MVINSRNSYNYFLNLSGAIVQWFYGGNCPGGSCPTGAIVPGAVVGGAVVPGAVVLIPLH